MGLVGFFFFFSSKSHSFYLLGKFTEAVAGICRKFNRALGKQCKILLGVTSAHFSNLEKKKKRRRVGSLSPWALKAILYCRLCGMKKQ